MSALDHVCAAAGCPDHPKAAFTPRVKRTVPEYRIKTRPCSACGGEYSSPRVQKGSRHKGCLASPAGRFSVPGLQERP